MDRDYKEYDIYDSVTPQAVTSSTDASPVVVTKSSHGLVTGNKIVIFGHATNTTVNGIWDVEVVNSSTFKLKDVNTGAYVVGAGGGAGSGGVMCKAPKVILASDFRHIELELHTSGSFNATFKVVGSLGKKVSDQTAASGDAPNFGATQAASNPWVYLQSIALVDGSVVDGGTGFTSAGTDLHAAYEVNINAIKYITVIPTAWTAGVISLKARLFNNE